MPLTPGSTPSIPGSTPAAGQYRWIVGASTLSDLLAHDTTGVVKRTFDTPSTYVVVGAHLGLPAGWVSIPVQTFTSYSTMAGQLASGRRVLPGVKAVLYDNEHWSFTPAQEQADPARYDALGAALAHRFGLTFIAAPAMDLASSMGRAPGEPLDHAYLRLGIPAAAARHADVFEVQAQGYEDSPEAYAALLNAAVSQARQANPSVVILAGLSTNHSGHLASAAQILAAIHAAPSQVTGFWMNDPAGGPYCPKCTGPYPATAIEALAGT